MVTKKPLNVDEYIAAFSDSIQKILQSVRETILKTAPEAIEKISYGIPAYSFNGKPVVYFAGFKNHIGFYATPSGHKEFEKELSKYKQGKGSVQFPIADPMPFALIKKIVRFRLKKAKEINEFKI